MSNQFRELLEDEPEGAEADSARSPSRSFARSLTLEEDLPAGRPVEPAEELEQRRLAGPARAFDRDESPASIIRSTHLDRVDHDRTAIEGLADAAKLVLAHSTVLRASAGRRRAARRAQRLRLRAGHRSQQDRSLRAGTRDPDRRCQRDGLGGRARDLLDTEEVATARGRAGGQRRPEDPDRQNSDADADARARTPPGAALGRGTRRRPGVQTRHSVQAKCLERPRARVPACRPTKAQATRPAGTLPRRRRSRARAPGCARGWRRRRASR